ncbi:ZIFL1 [Symbiodinium necroappetens]|uniref:ZIFL1 protein n=1 Tax=Symbiodinium necroappetens TaxID=1628268 RepID=A0A812YXP6_9DINO|nr:ZIFL1 [Symbiodinium necroappetens]
MQLVGPAIGGWTYNIVPSFPAVIPSMIGCILAVALFAFFLRIRHDIRSPQKAAEPGMDAQPGTPSKPSASAHKSVGSLLRTWPVPVVIFMRLWNGFATFSIFEAAPLWLVSDRNVGGLGMTEKEVGSLLSRSGLWNLFYFSFLMPRFAKALGERWVSAIFCVVGAAAATILPFCTSPLMANVVHMLAASATMSQAAMNIAFTNNAAGQEGRAVVTGVAVTVETIGKALGPIVTSTMFAWCVRTWGLQGHGAVFFVLACLSVVQLICTTFLPAYVESHSLRRRGHEPIAAEEPQKEVPATVLGLEETTPVMHRAHSG